MKKKEKNAFSIFQKKIILQNTVIGQNWPVKTKVDAPRGHVDPDAARRHDHDDDQHLPHRRRPAQDWFCQGDSHAQQQQQQTR